MVEQNRTLYKTNWNKFEEAMNDVVHKEMCRVFLWLYKGGSKNVWEYLEEVQGGKNDLNKDEKKTLKKETQPTRMDITLLYCLLQRVCGLAKPFDPIWFSTLDSNSPSLEHTLYLIKQERNLVSHEGHKREAREMSDGELDRKLSLLQRLCANLLVEASRRCGRLGEIVKLIDNMEARLRDIQGVTADRFVQMAREEKMKAAPREKINVAHEKDMKVTQKEKIKVSRKKKINVAQKENMIVARRKKTKVERNKMADEWYQQPLLRLQSQPVRLADLLQWQAADGGVPSFLLVSGEPGVGKSSMCRYLEECWLRPQSGGKDLLHRYDLVLRVSCKEICTSDVVRLLKEELLPEVAPQCNRDTLSEILCNVPILWVLDGLEEATDQAKQLLSFLLRNRRPKSTVLATSWPEFGRDFLRQHPNDGTQLCVSLLGTDPLEAIHRAILSTNCDEDTESHAKRLTEEFKKLDKCVQQELQNPLKLRLALQDWKAMRSSTLRREFEFSRLYQKITKAQIESLSEKVSEELSMTKYDATRKVEKWFSFFCESTFYLVQSKKISVGAAREAFFKNLVDKCDHLRILSSKCLSTFLANSDSVFSTDNNNYTFYHDSQVHFLAARHIASVMKASKCLPTEIFRLFNITALMENSSEAPPLLHFFPVLLFLVSFLDDSTPNDNIKMVIKLLLNAIPLNYIQSMWFEVAKKASYEPEVMREIGKVIPKSWKIDESSIEAAKKMVEYQQPDQVTLRVFSKPGEVNELEPLIRTLASLPIVMRLDLLNHTMDLAGNDTADAYLEIICRKESRCILVALQAHLGNIGYGLLKHPNIVDSCRAMKVKVKSIKSLETLCECVQHFESLKGLFLVLAMKELPSTSAKLPNVGNSIQLPYLTKNTAVKTAKFVAGLSLSYDELLLCDVAYSAVERLLLNLQTKDVTVNNIFGIDESIGSKSQAISFGPLPIECTWLEFAQRWSKFRVMLRTMQRTRDV